MPSSWTVVQRLLVCVPLWCLLAGPHWPLLLGFRKFHRVQALDLLCFLLSLLPNAVNYFVFYSYLKTLFTDYQYFRPT